MAIFISKNSHGFYEADEVRYTGDLNLTELVAKEVAKVKSQVSRLKTEIKDSKEPEPQPEAKSKK